MTKTLMQSAIVLATAASLCGSVSAQDNDNRLEQRLRHLSPDRLPAPPTPYWIGVRCSDDKHQPLVVRELIAGAPAEKAGILVGDEIVAAGNLNLETVKQLAKAVQDSEGEPLELTVRRNEEELNVKVTPARRKLVDLTLPPGPGPMELSEWIQRQAKRGLGPGFNMRLVNPGVVFESRRARFPDDTRIILERKSDAPVTIEIRQGDESWEVSRESLDELPKDLRQWARVLLRLIETRRPDYMNLPPDIHLLLPPGFSERNAGPARKEAASLDHEELRNRVDELSRQVEALRRTLDASDELEGDRGAEERVEHDIEKQE